MDPHSVEEYIGRDWNALEASKRAHWAQVFQRQGWQPVWEASQALSRHVRHIQPSFPSDRDRLADLTHHILLRATLDRAADAFLRR